MNDNKETNIGIFRDPREKGLREWKSIDVLAKQGSAEAGRRPAVEHTETSDEAVPTNRGK